MASIELKRSVRRAYELARARRAVAGAVPIVLIVGLAAIFAQRPALTLAIGFAAAALGAFMLFFGRDPQKAVLPGIGAGLLPLALAIGTSQLHACRIDGCTSLCMQACMVGGALAGLAVAFVGHSRGAGVSFWVSASGLALLIGAAGSACIGTTGLAGLGVGYVIGIAPGLLRRSLRRPAS